MITKDALTEFKAIIKRDYGEDLSDKSALEIANNFLISLEAILNQQLTTDQEMREK